MKRSLRIFVGRKLVARAHEGTVSCPHPSKYGSGDVTIEIPDIRLMPNRYVEWMSIRNGDGFATIEFKGIRHRKMKLISFRYLNGVCTSVMFWKLVPPKQIRNKLI